MHIYIILQSKKVAAEVLFSWIELTMNSVTVQQQQQHDKLYLHDYIKLQYCKSFKIKLQVIVIIIRDNKPIKKTIKNYGQFNSI